MLYACWGWATRVALVNEDMTSEMKAAVCRRIIIAQSLYAGGAALCFFSAYLSIAVILLIQLNHALAPKSWIRKPKLKQT
jgi:hypothetical protein